MGSVAGADKATTRPVDAAARRTPHARMTSEPRMTRAERIAASLTAAFQPSRLDVVDDSARHAGHSGARPGGETHYTVTIEAEAFRGLGRVERHRRVNAALAAEFDGGLHALGVVARAPGE